MLQYCPVGLKRKKLSHKLQYASFLGEGLRHSQKKNFNRAVNCFKRALIFQPNSIDCRLKLAKSLLATNKLDGALFYINSILKEHPDNFHAIQLKAQVKYEQANFEQSMVLFQRLIYKSNRTQIANDGIFKAQLPMCNNIPGKPIKMPNKHMELFYEKEKIMVTGDNFFDTSNLQGFRKQEKFAKSCLGELYTHYHFIRKLLDGNCITNPDFEEGKKIRNELQAALDYLNARIRFWSRHSWNSGKFNVASDKDKEAGKHDYNIFINSILPRVINTETMLCNEEYRNVLEECNDLIEYIFEEIETNGFERTKFAVIFAKMYTLQGIAYERTNELENALISHINSLKQSQDCATKRAKSESLNNIGNTYALMGQLESAIKYWLLKVPLCQDASEKVILYHEIGKAYFLLHDYQLAESWASKGVIEANNCEDEQWIMYNSLLFGQVLRELHRYDEAVFHFEGTLELAINTENSEVLETLEKIFQSFTIEDNPKSFQQYVFLQNQKNIENTHSRALEDTESSNSSGSETDSIDDSA